jgi:hypothetical protein
MTKPFAWRSVITALVWIFWLGLTADVMRRYLHQDSAVPLAEDWLMVAPMTGHESNFSQWLWAQNNEHRIPVPRLVYLGVLKMSHGDFRAQGVANLALMSASAAGLILFVRRLRGGHTLAADVFFPLLFLHWGHSVQYQFPFLVSLIMPVMGALALGCVMAIPRLVVTPAIASLVGATMLLMPLCGLPGLLLVAAPVAYFSYVAWAMWSGQHGWIRDRRVSGILLGSVALVVAESCLYFVGYERAWSPPPVGLVAKAQIALLVLSYQFGLGSHLGFRSFGAVTVLLWVATAVCFALAAWKKRDQELVRPLAFAMFAANAVVFALAIGWARASWVKDFGVPTRYVLFAVPAAVACFIAWEVWGGPVWRRWMPRALAVILLVLLPWNTRAGSLYFSDWYDRGMTTLHRDVRTGMPMGELARKHQPFLIHWWKPADLETRMRWLKEAGIEPFARVADPDGPSAPP